MGGGWVGRWGGNEGGGGGGLEVRHGLPSLGQTMHCYGRVAAFCHAEINPPAARIGTMGAILSKPFSQQLRTLREKAVLNVKHLE